MDTSIFRLHSYETTPVQRKMLHCIEVFHRLSSPLPSDPPKGQEHCGMQKTLDYLKTKRNNQHHYCCCQAWKCYPGHICYTGYKFGINLNETCLTLSELGLVQKCVIKSLDWHSSI